MTTSVVYSTTGVVSVKRKNGDLGGGETISVMSPFARAKKRRERWCAVSLYPAPPLLPSLPVPGFAISYEVDNFFLF